MKLAERAPAAPSSFKAKASLWRPEAMMLVRGAETAELLQPEPADRYAAIDDIGAGIVVLRVSRWPKVDGWGRLAFPKGGAYPVTVQLPLDDFQAQVNFQRAQHAQAAPERPLRVGDVFLIRGMPKDVVPIDAEMWDISAAGRNVAKAAYYGAGAATVDDDYIEKMGAVAPEPMEESPSGTFDIRQQQMPPEGPKAMRS